MKARLQGRAYIANGLSVHLTQLSIRIVCRAPKRVGGLNDLFAALLPPYSATSFELLRDLGSTHRQLACNLPKSVGT